VRVSSYGGGIGGGERGLAPFLEAGEGGGKKEQKGINQYLSGSEGKNYFKEEGRSGQKEVVGRGAQLVPT